MTLRERERAPHMQTARKSRVGCLWAVILFQALALLALLAIGGLAFLLRSSLPRPGAVGGAGVDENPDFTEVWSCGAGPVKVVRIPLTGMILMEEEGGLFSRGSGSAVMALRSIRRATHDARVRAIILEVDSGGGGITASDVLYHALEEFRRSADGRRIVSIFGDVAASGAYYVAAASDYIVARPTSVTGSIGVLLHSLNIRELSQKIGVRSVTIKSGANKDLLNPFEDLTEEQKRLLQALVDEFYDRFVALVADGRALDTGRVRALADGRVFTASQALELGLVDEIGYWEHAVARTAELLAVRDVKVYRYEPEFSLASLIRSRLAWDPAGHWVDELSQLRLVF